MNKTPIKNIKFHLFKDKKDDAIGLQLVKIFINLATKSRQLERNQVV